LHKLKQQKEFASLKQDLMTTMNFGFPQPSTATNSNPFLPNNNRPLQPSNNQTFSSPPPFHTVEQKEKPSIARRLFVNNTPGNNGSSNAKKGNGFSSSNAGKPNMNAFNPGAPSSFASQSNKQATKSAFASPLTTTTTNSTTKATNRSTTITMSDKNNDGDGVAPMDWSPISMSSDDERKPAARMSWSTANGNGGQ
jgi:hypothetical protein